MAASRRRLSSGFQQIAAAQGHPPVEIAASLSALDPAEKSPLRVDPEGALSAGPQSKGKMLLQLGVSYVTGKVLDDLMEEGIKAGLGAAAAGTAATAARYTSLAVGATLSSCNVDATRPCLNTPRSKSR